LPERRRLATRANGADFQRSVIFDTRFDGADLLAANFDGAWLAGADFTAAALSLATFRGAMPLAPVCAGADLKNADFKGVVLSGTDVLADLATGVGFQPQIWRADRVGRDEVMQAHLMSEHLTPEDVDRITGSAPTCRLTRVQPFDDGAAP